MRDEFFRLLFFIGKKKKKKKETSTNNENALVGVSGQSADRECFLQCVLWAAVKRDGFFMIWRMKSLHARLRPQEDDASVINQRQMRNWSANQSETILPNSPKENCYYKKTTSFLTFANFFFEKQDVIEIHNPISPPIPDQFFFSFLEIESITKANLLNLKLRSRYRTRFHH